MLRLFARPRMQRAGELALQRLRVHPELRVNGKLRRFRRVQEHFGDIFERDHRCGLLPARPGPPREPSEALPPRGMPGRKGLSRIIQSRVAPVNRKQASDNISVAVRAKPHRPLAAPAIGSVYATITRSPSARSRRFGVVGVVYCTDAHQITPRWRTLGTHVDQRGSCRDRRMRAHAHTVAASPRRMCGESARIEARIRRAA